MQQFVYNHLPISYYWKTNAKRREEEPALSNKSHFLVLISCLFSTNRHPLMFFLNCEIGLKGLKTKIISQEYL
jgi:hypothetical protein